MTSMLIHSSAPHGRQPEQDPIPGGLGWGVENLKVAVCRMVALWATVATRRGVWGARVSMPLIAPECPPSALEKTRQFIVHSQLEWGALQREQIHLHTRPQNPPARGARPSMRYNFRNSQPSQPPDIPAFSSPQGLGGACVAHNAGCGRVVPRAAFSLIEILVAVSMLAIALAALVQLSSVSRRHLEAAAEKSTAARLAANQMARLAAGIDPLKDRGPEPLGEAPDWHCRIATLPVAGAPGLVEVEVSVAQLPAVDGEVEAAPQRWFTLTQWLKAEQDQPPSDPGATTP